MAPNRTYRSHGFHLNNPFICSHCSHYRRCSSHSSHLNIAQNRVRMTPIRSQFRTEAWQTWLTVAPKAASVNTLTSRAAEFDDNQNEAKGEL